MVEYIPLLAFLPIAIFVGWYWRRLREVRRRLAAIRRRLAGRMSAAAGEADGPDAVMEWARLRRLRHRVRLGMLRAAGCVVLILLLSYPLFVLLVIIFSYHP